MYSPGTIKMMIRFFLLDMLYFHGCDDLCVLYPVIPDGGLDRQRFPGLAFRTPVSTSHAMGLALGGVGEEIPRLRDS